MRDRRAAARAMGRSIRGHVVISGSRGVERQISVTGESEMLRAAVARLDEILRETAVGRLVHGPIGSWFPEPSAHAWMVAPPHGALVRGTWALDRIAGPGSLPDRSRSVARFEASRGACDGWAG